MGGLFKSGGSVSSSAPVISSLQLQTSSYGRPIPWVFGQQRVAPNLIQYEDFKSIPHKSSQRTGKGGSGGGGTTDYTYTVAAAMALGAGPLQGIGRVWKDKEKSSLGELRLDFYNGSNTQTPYPYFLTTHPDRALAYRGIAYVASGAYDLGSSAGMGNHTFEVQAPGSVGSRYGVAVPDAEIADVITAILTDVEQGVGIDPSGLGDMAQFRAYCLANGLWVSPAYTEQRGAFDYIKTLLTIGFADCVYSDGQFKIVPYSDRAASSSLAIYTPTIAPVYDLDEDDFLYDQGGDAVKVFQKSTEQSYNHVRVKFPDRANDYNDNIAEAKDDADIELNGLRSMDVVDMREIADAAVAQAAANFLLHRSLYILNTYEFRLPWKYARLEPMDVVTLNYARKFLAGTPVLITEISEEGDDQLVIKAEDYPLGSNRAQQPVPDIGNSAPNYAVPPGNVNVPVLFEPPARLTDGASQVWMALSGGVDWGGCEVWVSADGTSYQRVGTVRSKAVHGVLTATLAAGGALDVAHTLSVDVAAAGGTLTPVSQSNADSLVSTCYVDGEYIAYSAAVLQAVGKYDLSYLVRGAYGPAIVDHAAGASFALLDNALFRWTFPSEWVGKTMWFKFVSFNSFGGARQDISTVPAYQRVLHGATVSAVVGLVTSPRPFGIGVSWSLPPGDLDYLRGTELWQSTSADRSTAVLVDSLAAPQSSFVLGGLNAGETRYFWVRLVDRMGNAGAFYPAGAGVAGQTSTDAASILSYLGGVIGKTQLAQDLLKPIEDAEEVIGPMVDRVNELLNGKATDELAANQLLAMINGDKALTDTTQKVGTRIETVRAESKSDTAALAQQVDLVGAAVGQNAAAIVSEQTARVNADGALGQRIDTVVAQAGQTAAAVQSEQTARVNADGALGQRIDTAQAKANDASAAVQQTSQALAQTDGKLAAQYTLKTQVTQGGRRYLAGIAVGVEVDGPAVESQILLSADRLAVVSEANGGIITPFVVQNGQVFINQAFIGDAWIKAAHIQNAAVDTLTIAGNAVTTMASASGIGSASVTFNAYGAPIYLAVTGVGIFWSPTGDAFSGTTGLTIFRDGTAINSISTTGLNNSGVERSQSATCVHIDYPGAGTHTYTFIVSADNAGYARSGQINAAILETRR
jgi:hypothetical protein